MSTSAQWLVDAVEGTLASADAQAVVTGRVCVDTRRLKPGDVFVALPGGRQHGRDYVGDALEKGADGVIAAEADLPRAGEAKLAIAVSDPLAALRRLARARRMSFTGPVVAVTGSCGKTTTTAVLANMLGTVMPTHSTSDGFNTHLGVAATVAGLDDGDEALVVEVAMQSRGHIAEKVGLLSPTAGLITNIAPVHLATAGSLADVASNKAELIEGLPPGSVCVIPAREPLLEAHRRSDLRLITHGPGGDVSLVDCHAGLARIDCVGTLVSVRTPLTQPHNLSNLVAATALLHALDIPISACPPTSSPPLRWELARLGEAELVLDCFSNHPTALHAALVAFGAEPAVRRLAILGGFTELGAETTAYHTEGGLQAEALGIDLLITVGAEAREYLYGYRGPHRCVETPLEARRLLLELARPGDRVLVKGCRSARLEQVVK